MCRTPRPAACARDTPGWCCCPRPHAPVGPLYSRFFNEFQWALRRLDYTVVQYGSLGLARRRGGPCLGRTAPCRGRSRPARSRSRRTASGCSSAPARRPS